MKARRPPPASAPPQAQPATTDGLDPELHAQYAALHRTLTGALDLRQGATRLGVDPQRLGIYRGFVQTHLRTAVETNFNLTAAFITQRSPAAWRHLRETFVAQARPHHWTLDAAAEGFAEHLGAQVGRALPAAADRLRLTPFDGALATLEWALLQAHVDPVDLSAPAPDETARGDGAFRLNPTLSLLALPEGTAALAAALNRDERPEVPAPAPVSAPDSAPNSAPNPATEIVLVLRRPQTERAVFNRPDADLLFAFKAVHDGLTAAAAAETTGQPRAAIDAAFAAAERLGLILPA